MKKLLSATAFAICALITVCAQAIDLPSWVFGTWGGGYSYYDIEQNKDKLGLYKLTLSATSVQEEYKIHGKESWEYTDAWNEVKITDQSECHLVLSFQGWSNSHAQDMVLRKDGCAHYDTSYYSSKITDDDTENKNELTKLEMNTAPTEGWPEWVVGTWNGSLSVYVSDQNETFIGAYTLTVSDSGTTAKCVFDDGDGFNEEVRGFVITDKTNCHIAGTCWRWKDSKRDWYDMNFVFRNTACSHHTQSSCKSITHIGSDGMEPCDVANLKKDGGDPEPSMSMIEWPSWAIGAWAGTVDNYVASEWYTYNDFCKLELSATGPTVKYTYYNEEYGSIANFYDWRLTEQDDCHIIISFWFWNSKGTVKYDGVFKLCNTKCNHYSSSFSAKGQSTTDSMSANNITKLETNLIPAEEWPSWVLGTWSGTAENYIPDPEEPETCYASYILTLTSSGSEEKYIWKEDNGTETYDGSGEDNLKGWVITERKGCHIKATCWYWSDDEDFWFDAKYVFRNSACTHYNYSTFSSEAHGGGDTINVKNLVKNGGTPAPSEPYVSGDDGATIEGDAEKGYTITPSSDEVVVTIPSGVSADKVTVKVSPEAKVTPNGAAVMVMKGGHDIASYLDFPAMDASGMIDLSKSTVKEEIVKETLSVEKGAEISLSPDKPMLTTPKTRSGLTYRLKEGATLEAMKANTTGASTVGDGNPWTPTITVSGGSSAFYTIEVTK